MLLDSLLVAINRSTGHSCFLSALCSGLVLIQQPIPYFVVGLFFVWHFGGLLKCLGCRRIFPLFLLLTGLCAYALVSLRDLPWFKVFSHACIEFLWKMEQMKWLEIEVIKQFPITKWDIICHNIFISRDCAPNTLMLPLSCHFTIHMNGHIPYSIGLKWEVESLLNTSINRMDKSNDMAKPKPGNSWLAFIRNIPILYEIWSNNIYLILWWNFTLVILRRVPLSHKCLSCRNRVGNSRIAWEHEPKRAFTIIQWKIQNDPDETIRISLPRKECGENGCGLQCNPCSLELDKFRCKSWYCTSSLR